MEDKKSSSQKREWLSAVEWLVSIVSAVAIALTIRAFVFAPYEVHGASMYPTLEGNELLIVNKWVYRVGQPKYGDIVVFHTKEERDFIKRVIGLPGDRIQIMDGKVYRNGEELHEDYINGQMNPDTFVDTIVPPNMLYVLGDNRNNSKDSRNIGPIEMSEIVGRADIVILPIQKMHFLSR